MRENLHRSIRSLAAIAGLLPVFWLAPSPAIADHHNPCNAKVANPCGAKKMNPCNPCGAKKKMNPCNPCGAKANPCNPCGAKKMNPCNPCGASRVNPTDFKQPRNTSLAQGNRAALLAEGEKLWNDRALGKSGLACSSCHVDNYTLMQPTFAKAYPHQVAMPKQMAGVDSVNAAEMVNFCMLVPMKDEPLAWGSHELAALTQYVESIRPNYKPVKNANMANPCNPCSPKMNPCNPRAPKSEKMNPCNRQSVANPCGAMSKAKSWWKFW